MSESVPPHLDYDLGGPMPSCPIACVFASIGGGRLRRRNDGLIGHNNGRPQGLGGTQWPRQYGGRVSLSKGDNDNPVDYEVHWSMKEGIPW